MVEQDDILMEQQHFGPTARLVAVSLAVMYLGWRGSQMLRQGVRHFPHASPFEKVWMIVEVLVLLMSGMVEASQRRSPLVLIGLLILVGSNGASLSQGRKCTGLMFRLVVIGLFCCTSTWWSSVLFVYLEAMVAVAGVFFGEGNTSQQFDTIPCKDLEFGAGNKKINKITILTMGSRGDVQPFIALALELQEKHGIKVVISTMSEFKNLVERHGIEYFPCGLKDIAHDDTVWREATHVSEVIVKAREGATQHYTDVAHNFLAACKGSDAILATAVTQSFAFNIAEFMHIPTWIVKLSPDTPTRAFSPPGKVSSSVGLINLIRWYVHWGSVFFAARNGVTMKRENPENSFRVEVLKLKPLGGGKRIRQISNVQTICAYSPTICPKPADYPVNIFVSGWWFVNTTGDNKQDNNSKVAHNPALDAFVTTTQDANAKRLICVNFGSMTETAKGFQVVQRVLTALSLYKDEVKVLLIDPTLTSDEIIQKEKAAYLNDCKGLDLFLLKEYPHDQIFPKCDIIVHHGGAGTTAAVLEFGKPSIIVPIMLWTDQPLWADRLQTLGCAVYLNRTSANLVTEIAQAYDKVKKHAEMPLNATKLGRAIAKESEVSISKSIDLILNIKN